MNSGAQHPDGPAQPLRSDAERNRERIIAAARTVFARDGLSASMASVAREAGVGIATMFRRFPTKEELVDAVFSDRMDAYADAVTVALEDPDPWNGFVGYIEAACAMQAADSGFADVLTMTFPTAKALE
ncbi:TetR/AcrR family transcriptional regulator, partial [Streptomyces coeruleorubidus]